MDATCAIVICGTESGITNFLTALYVRYPYTILTKEQNGGRFQGRLQFKEQGVLPEEIEQFICRTRFDIQTGWCCCNGTPTVDAT
jgi:hypothetical protein